MSVGGTTRIARAGRVTTLPAHLIPLDDRQRAFVLTYPEDFQPGKAAERAGYGNGNPESARVMGSRLMATPAVVSAILTELETRSERANIEAGKLLEELATVAFSSVDHFVIDDFGNVALAEGAPDKAIRSVSKIKKRVRHSFDKEGNVVGTTYETEISLWNKVEALNLAMKHRGMFIDRTLHVTGTLEEMLKVLAANNGAPR